ncbi:MAG: ribonuclease HII [Candidatus Cloacimonetes bacterium]|nr:ribonuclease HII [Candidatus Cloacimonadota bacterium]
MISEYKVFKNYKRIIGIDEAGRGPIAGPVVAAAVILPQDMIIPGLNDSKKLSQIKREEIYLKIKSCAIDYAVSGVNSKKIDKINILQATFLAMRKVFNKIKKSADYFLVDGPYLPTKSNVHKIEGSPSEIKSKILMQSIISQGEPIVKGDQKYYCIAAASILAKVYRDKLMINYHKKYPQFDFLHNKGYPTKKHIEAIQKYGITSIHRKTFSPISKNSFKLYTKKLT